MNLTKTIENLGFNPSDFTAEVTSLSNCDSVRRTYCSYLGESIDPHPEYSYKGVFDIMVTTTGEKHFMFSFNKQNGDGPMSYWWTVEKLHDGKWAELYGSGKYYGCCNYPTKFPKS